MIPIDDPRLTAYVLGECSEEERALVEQASFEQAEIAEEIVSIREMHGLLHAGLHKENILDSSRRTTVLEAAQQRKITWLYWAGPVIAASICASIAIPLMENTYVEKPAVNIVQVDGVDEKRQSIKYKRKGIEVEESEAAVSTTETGGVAQFMTVGRSAPSKKEPVSVEYHIGGGDYNEPIVMADGLPSQAPVYGLHDTIVEERKESSLRGSVIHGESVPVPEQNISRESYDPIYDTPFKKVTDKGNDVSTFSIDVDTASYSNVRRYLQQNHQLPPVDAVRIEEMINAFDYVYTAPEADDKHPFKYNVSFRDCPWNKHNRMARVALKGKIVSAEQRPSCNLVFLIDVSGSMQKRNKLPLLKKAFGLLLEQLDERDSVALVTYAGSSGLVLPPTSGAEQATILAAFDRLSAGGSTNGGAGIQLAYHVAQQAFISDGSNRVILATDGDFNVGITDKEELVTLLKKRAAQGVFLNVFGFGMGNTKDDMMERLSNNGNGTYAYIDSIREARKHMVEQFTGTLVTIAKDVKIQTFFNPEQIAAWRLIGYENRRLAARDFNDDSKDAGEIGAGHAVTALYEIVPLGSDIPTTGVDENPFTSNEKQEEPLVRVSTYGTQPAFQLRLRYKTPQGTISTLLEEEQTDRRIVLGFPRADSESDWAIAVAGFGLLLRGDQQNKSLTWESIINMARSARGPDPKGERSECIRLMEIARDLQ